MDLQFLTPLSGFLVAVLPLLGATAVFFINRWDKRRQAQEDQVKDYWKEKAADLETENKALKRQIVLMEQDGAKWLAQINRRGDKPDPPEWTHWKEAS